MFKSPVKPKNDPLGILTEEPNNDPLGILEKKNQNGSGGEDLYSGQRPSSYPLPKQKSGFSPQLESEEDNGLYPNADPKKYETKLPADQEPKFQKWLDDNYKAGKIQKGDYNFYKKNGYGYDYDFRAAFQTGQKPEINPDDKKWHWNDIGKKPNEPTFSNQSKYHGVDGMEGGTWDGNNFIPPKKPGFKVQLNLGEKQDFSPHTIYNNASQFILNDLENHPYLLKNAPDPQKLKEQIIKGYGDLNIQHYSAQRVGDIEKQQKDLMDKIGEEMFGLSTDHEKVNQYKQQISDLENKKSDFKNNVSEINDIQAVTMTPPPTDPKDQTEYLREIGRKVNKLNNPLGIEDQEKHIRDGTNVTKDKELLDLENFNNEQAGIEAKKKQLNVALGNGEINQEQYRVQHAGLTLAENKLLLNNPGAKTVINRNALSKIIEEKRSKDNPLDAYSGSLFHDIIRYTPSDKEVKDAIKTAKGQGYPIGEAEEKRLIADKAMIPGTSALGNLYSSSIGSLGVAVNKHNPFLNESQIESAEYQHESRLEPTQRQTKGVLGYVNQTANVVGTVLKWATLGKFLGAGANAIAGESVGAETIGGIDESLGGIKQLTQAQQHLAGTALTSGLLVYPEAKEEAKKFTKDEAKQEAYAGTMTLLNTLAFTSLNPEGILKDIVGDLGKSDFSKEFLKVVNKAGGIEKLEPETFKETLVNGLKKAAGANVSATATMSLLNLATQATDVMFGKKPNVDYNELGKEAVNSFISFAPISLLQGAGVVMADRHKRDITIQLVNRAAKDPIAFKNYMDNAVEEGKVSREDANKKISIVNSHAALSKSVNLPEHISEENKAGYVDNLRREIDIKQSIKGVEDEVLLKPKEEEIKVLQEERKNILEAPPKNEEEKLVNEARDSKQLGVYGTLNNEEVLKEIAKQAQNVQQGGTKSDLVTDKQAYEQTVRNFGENKELVDAAIAKHPEESLVKPVEHDFTGKDNNFLANREPNFFTPKERETYNELMKKPETEAEAAKMVSDKKEEIKNFAPKPIEVKKESSKENTEDRANQLFDEKIPYGKKYNSTVEYNDIVTGKNKTEKTYKATDALKKQYEAVRSLIVNCLT